MSPERPGQLVEQRYAVNFMRPSEFVLIRIIKAAFSDTPYSLGSALYFKVQILSVKVMHYIMLLWILPIAWTLQSHWVNMQWAIKQSNVSHLINVKITVVPLCSCRWGHKLSVTDEWLKSQFTAPHECKSCSVPAGCVTKQLFASIGYLLYQLYYTSKE